MPAFARLARARHGERFSPDFTRRFSRNSVVALRVLHADVDTRVERRVLSLPAPSARIFFAVTTRSTSYLPSGALARLGLHRAHVVERDGLEEVVDQALMLRRRDAPQLRERSRDVAYGGPLKRHLFTNADSASFIAASPIASCSA